MPGLSVLRPEWLLALLLVPVLYLVWRRWPPPLARRRGRASLALRIALVALLAFALAGVRVTIQPHQRALIAVVDLSASTRHSIDEEGAAVKTLAAGKGADDLFGVVTFAHDAAVELPPTRTPHFELFSTQPDPTYTDVAGALRLAAGIIPDGYARQLVLVSDGRQNLGDAAATIAALRAEGIRVDVLPVGSPLTAEVLIASVDAPAQLRVGEHGTASVRIQSIGPATGQLVFSADGKQLESRDVSVPAGISTVTFALPDFDTGLHKVRAELVNASPDTYPDNNVGEAAIRVLGRPAVLVLEGNPGAGDNLVAALTAAGTRVDRRPAAEAPVDTNVLGRYDTVVVADAPADAFPAGALDAIEATVRDLGHGLVTIGGPSSYGPGGWQNTGLERALPVRMDLPPRKEKPRVAVVLMLETTEVGALDQIVTTGAAEAVIAGLGPDDQVAVTDNQQGFIVPMQHVTDKKAIDAQLEKATLGDGPYLKYFRLAGDALAKTDAPLKHIVVLGDGDEIHNDSTAYQDLIQGYRVQGITTSAVGINTHSDAGFMANMQDLARWGGGRFYEADSTEQVPQLFLKESQVALRPWYEQSPFFPRVTAGGDLLAGVPLDAFPQLGGYVVTTPKPGAEVYFTSPKDDPVLAGWQYGLGRSVAWMSDARGQWTAAFLASQVSAKLFAQMVAWTLPTGTGDQLQTEATVTGDSLEVKVTGPSTINGAAIRVGVLAPDLTSSNVNLPAIAPGQWQGRLPISAVGTYLLHVALLKGAAVSGQSDVAVVVPYSPEYLSLGRDSASLTEFAKVGGSLLSKPERAWSLAALPVPTSSDVFWFLLLLVAILWPLDIALRRLTMSPAQALAAARALAALRRPEGIELEAPPELARLRNRVAPYRRRGAAAPPPIIASAEARRSEAEPRQTEEVDAEALSARLLEARRKRRGSGD
jgi:Ca-activated chloride channel family protein